MKLKNLNSYQSEETPPRPAAMINTFRAFGYNLQTAVADIVDNSISAGATEVSIRYVWDGENSWVSIADNGHGMDQDELVAAMTPGSKDPLDERDEHDLGRFGLGLKTASFSQCKALTVATRQAEHALIKRSWDLDFVNETGKWTLLDYISDESLITAMREVPQGTMVIWQKLDRLVGAARPENEAARRVFLEEFDRVAQHLSMVFHRYIEKKKLTIRINGQSLKAWDPFLKEHGASRLVATEKLDQDRVEIRCTVLPHISQLTPEQRRETRTDDWYRLQGFYIYRQNRLLLAGDWLGLFPKGEHYKNARILVEIPNALDHDWKIDIRKATATPPFHLHKDLIRLGKICRQAAAEIYRYRGKTERLAGQESGLQFQALWLTRLSREEERSYHLNDQHPILAQALNKENISRAELKTILKLVAETIPIEAIIQFQHENPESHELRQNQPEPEAHTIQLAQQLFGMLVSTGLTEELARRQILNIEPFHLYPQLIEYLH